MRARVVLAIGLVVLTSMSTIRAPSAPVEAGSVEATGSKATPSVEQNELPSAELKKGPVDVPVPSRVAASSATECELLVYTPPTAAAEFVGEWCDTPDSPSGTAVVLVHGGGEVGGSRSDTAVSRDEYLKAGLATFSIDYRLGDPFDPKPIWPVPEQNVKAAIQFVRGIGPSGGINRIVVHGFSAGARLAAIAHTTVGDEYFDGPELWPNVSDAVDAVTLFYGYYDGSTSWSDYFAGDAPDVASAIENARRAKERGVALVPALVVHGRGDFLISELQSMRLSAALVEAHTSVDLQVVNAQVSHGFDGYGADSLSPAGRELVRSVLAHASSDEDRAPLSHVLLIGDSIANEATDELRRQLLDRGVGLDAITWWGIAPCDVLDVVTEHLDGANSIRPDAAIILFTGNAITPCMDAASDVGSASYFETYERDMTLMIEQLHRESTDIWIPEGLPLEDTQKDDVATELADRLSRLPGVAGTLPFVDLFTDADGAYARELPCVLRTEPCEVVPVRANDGGHLGEDESPFGRVRMAHAIVRFLSRTYRYN